MTLAPLSIPAGAWSDPNQHRVMKQIETNSNAAAAAIAGLTDANGALQLVATTQPHVEAVLISFPDNLGYELYAELPFAFTITRVICTTTAGTCTVVVALGGIALGGGSSLASTTPSTVTHTTANVGAIGAGLVVTVSANASAEGLNITMIGTRSYEVQ